MLAATLLATAAALAPTYAGRSDEGRRVVIETTNNRVTLVHAAIEDYECDQFGQIGPVRIHERPKERVPSDGKVSVTSGDRTGRVTLKATFTKTKVTGTLRVRGTIATGQACTSKTLRFSAVPRP